MSKELGEKLGEKILVTEQDAHGKFFEITEHKKHLKIKRVK